VTGDEDQLRTAIADLRTSKDLPPLAPDEMNRAVRQLLVSGGKARRKKPTPELQNAAAALENIAKLADELKAAIADLHPSISNFSPQAREDMRRRLHIVSVVARADLGPPVEEPAPVNSAQHLAYDAACIFLMTTGTKPGITNRPGRKAHGLFIEFLAKVFAARGVTASVEASARRAIDLMEFSRVKTLL
jgi:hypothetical protein